MEVVGVVNPSVDVYFAIKSAIIVAFLLITHVWSPHTVSKH